MSDNDLLKLTADIVAEYAATNRVAASELPRLIQATYHGFSALGELSATTDGHTEDRPAVSARKSLSNPNFILSMLDGKPYTMLKRHLARHGLTPDEYRKKFGLKPDYPMTAPTYSAHRSELAKIMGLGSNRRGKGTGRKPRQAKRKLT